MSRNAIIIGAIIGAFGVAIGAFGAHGLANVLEATGRADTFQTASEYQMYHALALVLVGVLAKQSPHRLLNWAGYAFLVGVVIFCGALYALAVLDLRFMGAIAPIGGTSFIIGWALMAWWAWKAR